MSESKRVAVIPAHGAETTIERTLCALSKAVEGLGYGPPIVVASPADDTAEIAESRGARVVRTRERLGAGAARNLGRNAAGRVEWILFVDADCAPVADSVRKLHQAVLHKRLDAAGASVVPDRAVGVAWVRHALEFKDAEPGGDSPWPGFAPSATFLCRVDAFDAVGGFPDLWPGEDLVFCSRLLRAGFRVRRVDAAVTVHQHPNSVLAMLRHQWVLGRSSAQARLLSPMDGAVWARHPAGVPLLGIGRMFRMLSWLLRRHRDQAVRFVALSPLYLAGLLAWCAGFARGAAAGRGS